MKQAIFLLILALGFTALRSQTVEWSQKANPINQSINSLAYRADGKKVLSGTNCHPASIRLFDVETAHLDWDYEVGPNYMCIMGVAFSSNSNYIAAIEEFGNMLIFDNTDTVPQLLTTLSTGTTYAFSTAISPDNGNVAIGCSSGKLKIYDLQGGSLYKDIAAHTGWVTTVTYSIDGTRIISGGSDNKVKIWDSAGSLLFTCNGHTGDITQVKTTPDNQLVVSCSADKTIRVWDLNTGALIRTISGHTNEIKGIDLSPDGERVVSASLDSTCRIWDLNTGLLINTFGVADSGGFTAVAWSPDGNRITSGNMISDITLWSLLPTNSIDKTALGNVILWPNPAKDYIELAKEIGHVARIQITDALGKIVLTATTENDRIFISHLPDGVYTVSVITSKPQFVARMVKMQ